MDAKSFTRDTGRAHGAHANASATSKRRVPGAVLAALCLAFLMAISNADAADNASTPKTSALPSALQAAVKSGRVKVVKQFNTAKKGLIGYVIEENGQHQIVYSDDGYLLLGELISPAGKNLSAEYTNKYVPKPDVASVVKRLGKSGHLVDQGNTEAPVIYAFADPNCIYCHRFYEQVQPMVKAGKLRLRWVMVGFLKSSSLGRAAAILSAENPAAALARNEAGFDEDNEEGGIKAVDSPSDKLKTVIQTYGKEMATAGGNGTPTLLYRTGKDSWAAKVGMPPQKWLSQYANNGHG